MSAPDLNGRRVPSGDATMATMGSARESQDAADFRRIFEATYDDLERFVRRRVAESAVDDVVAETFLVAWRRMDESPTELADVRPWIFGVARRILANTHRGQRRARALAVRIASQPSRRTHDDEAIALAVDLARAFRRLGPRDQEALALVSWDGLSPAQAARVLDISTSAFSVRLSRVRRRLREHLESDTSEGTSND